MPTRIDRLTPAQTAQMDAWADKWIEIGLRTGPADRPRFERAVADCYRYAGLEPPKVVVWTTSPLAVALAGPIAAHLLAVQQGRLRQSGSAVGDAVTAAVRDAVRDAVGAAVRAAVSDAVGAAVRAAVSDAVSAAVGDAVDAAVSGAVSAAVRDAVDAAVRDAVDAAVRAAVGGAVRAAVTAAVSDAVGGAVDDAVSDAVGDAVDDAVDRGWTHYLGGQFWDGGWWWGGAWTSFFREVAGLQLPGDLWDRARAYEATIESACWWWPHREFVIVSERPLAIRRELVNPERPRGWGSHRLHHDSGPAIVWPDGWGVWAIHGMRVPRQVVEAPETLTVPQITGERNAEIRRVMLDRFGAERYLQESGARAVQRDEYGTLYRTEIPGDEPLVMVRVVNSTPEPDGSAHVYWLRVPPTMTTAHEAVAWSFGKDAATYAPVVQS